MKRTMILTASLVLLVSSVGFCADKLAEQRYGINARQSVAMTLRYKNAASACSFTITGTYMSISVAGTRDNNVGNSGVITWSATNDDTDEAKTIGHLADIFNSSTGDMYSASVIDAMQGDSVMLLSNQAGTLCNSGVVSIVFQDATATTGTVSFQQIRMHDLPGERLSLMYAYTPESTATFQVFKGNTEIWRRVGTNSLDFTGNAALGLDSLYSADGLKDLTVRVTNSTEAWTTSEYLQIWYTRAGYTND